MKYRKLLGSKIHRATITEANLDYEGSITIPEDMMSTADLLTNEAVCVWNVTRGTRLETYAIKGEQGTGEICMNGAAAHLANVGDVVIIAKFVYLTDDELKSHRPIIILVDSNNKIVEVRGQEQ